MYIGIQTLPIIYVDNKTQQDIFGLRFYYEGMEFKKPEFKKIKPNDRKLISIYTRNLIGEKKLCMSYKDKEYAIFEKLTKDIWSNFLVEIESFDENDNLEIRVTPNFSL
ncbi:hypothetical protein V7014_18785 [Bacillus sp. JJ722]